MKQILNYFSLLIVLVVLGNGCASLSGFQDGRTTGKGNGEFGVSFNVNASPDFNDLEAEVDSTTVDIPNLYAPNIELSGRYGVAEKFDIGLRLNTNLNVGISGKYQLVGDRTSKTALAIGAEVGTFGLISGLWNVQVPLFFSLHPTEKFAWYLNPRYIHQFSAIGVDGSLNYIGGNTGLLFGNRNKFGIDIGYYSLGVEGGDRSGLLQIGLGGRFAIGRN